MIRQLASLLTLGALFAVVVTAGCAKKKLVAVENLPPETTLFVQGSLDTVNHIVRLFWFGSDPDGDVKGYEFRFENPGDPPDAPWAFTTQTDSNFTLQVPSGYTAPIFAVRAIDDRDQRDPTPARANFQFSNQAPTVRFINRHLTTDTTYASVTLAWTSDDPDGDDSALRFQIGLDTIPSALHLVSGSGITVDTTDFKIGGAYPTTRPRMAFIRAIDDGGRVSGWDSLRWVVRAPSAPGVHPRLLLIDDVPSSNPANLTIDTLWSNTAQRNLPAGSFSILRLDTTQPFRSTQDLAQTCRQFDAVIWYRGTQTTFSTLLLNLQDGLATYLDGGGKLLIESLDLIDGENANGPLREDWVTRYFGSRGLIRAPVAGFSDSTVSWSIRPNVTDTVDNVPINKPVILRSTTLSSPDSLRNGSNGNGLRAFDVLDTNHVVLWARDSTLSPRVPRGLPIGISVPVASPGGSGRVLVFTLPIRGANLFLNAPRFLAKVFQQMGLTGS